MIDWLFARPPKVGSEWGLRGYTNPFEDNLNVIVIEVRDGWVKYDWKWAEHSNTFYGSHKTIRNFRALYKEIKK